MSSLTDSRLGMEILARDGHRCVYCGASDDLLVDHVIPRSRGGGNTAANLAAACRSCNSSKSFWTVEEWEELGIRKRWPPGSAQ